MQYQLHRLRCSRHDHAEHIQIAWLPRHLRDGSRPTLEVIILGTLVFMLDITANMSTSYHPQTDGQTERTNRILEEVLRHYIDPSHTTWESLLPWVELTINSAVQESIKTTPFILNYGWQPTSPFELGLRDIHQHAGQPYLPEATQAVETAKFRITEARKCMQSAQGRYKHFADLKRQPITLTVGQLVLLSSKNIRITTTGTPKLLPRYLGLF
jgi:hypothetical protein